MCGIVAAIGRRAKSVVETMLPLIGHRGIRSSMEYGQGWAMGHARLPIVGLDESHDQPVTRGSWTYGFVGEVLDFKERHPTYECDTDLVVDLWHDRGPRCLTTYDGFWHVVAIDHGGGLYSVQDYLSQKPAYERCGDGFKVISSELDAIAAIEPVEFDRVYLSSVIKWGYCPEPWRTPYEGIRRSMPGELSYASDSCDGFTVNKIDRLTPRPASPEDLKDEIVKATYRRVLSSDVPVSCLLSGGIDSSIVYSIASRVGDVRSFHIENSDESEFARMVDPKVEIVDGAICDLETALDWMQEPIDLGSLVPQSVLSASVRRSGDYRVCLTGDGSDEMFGGYRRAQRYDSQASDIWHELVCWHLPRLDRIMMRNCIEVRSPFLARNVARIALSLPYSARVGKGILKSIFRSSLPSDVVDRYKVPLRTKSVEVDRESSSRRLVDMFIERKTGGSNANRE